MTNRLTTLAVLTAAVLGVAAVKAEQPPPVEAADFSGNLATNRDLSSLQGSIAVQPEADVTSEVQSKLASYGYTIVVDGIYGPQTTGVVKSWQRSNGLLEDGIAGPITQASLGLGGATVEEPAERAPENRSVEQIIRDVWPDELEDRAVTIAWRESRHQPDARNYCCHGLFQIYWTVHDGWMAGHGVTSLDQLYDAETNARMAYALYERAGGWGPWSQTDY